MKTITTDQENYSEKFWRMIAVDSSKNIFARMANLNESFYLTDEEAEIAEKYFSSVRGWNNSDSPDYARNPLIIEDSETELCCGIYNIFFESNRIIAYIDPKDSPKNEELENYLFAETRRDWTIGKWDKDSEGNIISICVPKERLIS